MSATPTVPDTFWQVGYIPISVTWLTVSVKVLAAEPAELVPVMV